MAVLKCEMCGGILNIEQGMRVVKCPYCGTCQTLENLYQQNQQEAGGDGRNREENLLERAWLALESRDFTQAWNFCEQALYINARNPKAYLAKLLAEARVSKIEELPASMICWTNLSSYKNLIQFADPDLREELESYAKPCREKYEKNKKQIMKVLLGTAIGITVLSILFFIVFPVAMLIYFYFIF